MCVIVYSYTFQLLIGKLRTSATGGKNVQDVEKFQLLIGKLRTIVAFSRPERFEQFQLLIGKLRTLNT